MSGFLLTDQNACGQVLEIIEQPIQIKITATASSELEETLEELALRISQVLIQDETLGGLVKTLSLEEDIEVSISHEGEQPIGILTMRFIALYRRPALDLSITCN